MNSVVPAVVPVMMTEGRKEMFYLTTHSTHFIYDYMASDIVNDLSDTGRENPLPPHGLLFPIISNGFFYMHHPTDRIPHTRPLLHQSWSNDTRVEIRVCTASHSRRSACRSTVRHDEACCYFGEGAHYTLQRTVTHAWHEMTLIFHAHCETDGGYLIQGEVQRALYGVTWCCLDCRDSPDSFPTLLLVICRSTL